MSDKEKPFHDSGSWSQKDISIVDELDAWGDSGWICRPKLCLFCAHMRAKATERF